MSEYRTLFDARGARYNRANRLFPGTRSEEALVRVFVDELVQEAGRAGTWLLPWDMVFASAAAA